MSRFVVFVISVTAYQLSETHPTNVSRLCINSPHIVRLDTLSDPRISHGEVYHGQRALRGIVPTEAGYRFSLHLALITLETVAQETTARETAEATRANTEAPGES